jgi:hypothetical protein
LETLTRSERARVASDYGGLRLLKRVAEPSQFSQCDRIDDAELGGELVDDVAIPATC